MSSETEQDDDEIEEELLESTFQVSPLNALDPDKIDLLTASQRAFLLAYIHTSSISISRKMAKVSGATWTRWAGDEQFQALFKIVKNPVAFSHALAQSIIFRAAVEHYKLLGNEKTSVRQWAIERAYMLNKIFDEEDGPDDGKAKQLSQSDVKQLAAGITAELSGPVRRRLESGPFAVIDAPFREVTDDELDGRADIRVPGDPGPAVGDETFEPVPVVQEAAG